MVRPTLQLTGSELTPERILKVGAEGGSLNVYGTHGAPDYQVVVSESALDEPEKASVWTPVWEGVIAHIARWPWPNLYPLFVHNDYRCRVMGAVLSFRDQNGAPVERSSLDRWQSLCAGRRAPLTRC